MLMSSLPNEGKRVPPYCSCHGCISADSLDDNRERTETDERANKDNESHVRPDGAEAPQVREPDVSDADEKAPCGSPMTGAHFNIKGLPYVGGTPTSDEELCPEGHGVCAMLKWLNISFNPRSDAAIAAVVTLTRCCPSRAVAGRGVRKDTQWFSAVR